MTGRIWDPYLTQSDVNHLARSPDKRVGFGSRPTRVVILSAGLILAGLLGHDDSVNPLSISVWILGAIGTVTTIQRILHVRRVLEEPPSAV